MRSIQRFAFVLLLASIVGCASAPTPTTLYLMRGTVVEQTRSIDSPDGIQGLRAGLGRVIVAPYLLASKGIMLETGEGEINPALYSQWAEPVDAGLRWYLSSELSASLGDTMSGGLLDRRSWDYTVDVIIAQLHGTMNGMAVIEAEFVVIAKGDARAVSQVRFAKSIPLAAEGYGALVAAEMQLARELAGVIADTLRDRAKP